MMAAPFPAHAGMGPGGHPGMSHGHPMAGMQHPGAGHMAGPNPGMMQSMHPGVSGPQVTQGSMIAGMPQGPVTSGPGGPMPNAHAMAHLGGPGQPNPMFQQNAQMTFNQMPPQQQQAMLRQRQMTMQMQQAQQQQQNMAGMMHPQGGHSMTPQQFATMSRGMPMNPQQQMQFQAAQQNAQRNLHQQQQQHMLAQQQQQQQAQQQQMLQAQQQQHRNASQQMQLSRSQEQASQAPQSHPTPAPQNPTQLQQQTAPPTPAPGAQPKQQPTQQVTSQPQQSQLGESQQISNQAQVKQQDVGAAMNALEDVPMNEAMGNGLTGQGILRLLMFQDQLCPPPDRVHDLEYWESFVQSHFSPFGVLRQQLFNPKTGIDKYYQVQYASLARFYHAHFASGVREVRMEPIGCTETKLPHGGCNVWSPKTYVTYIYDNDIRVITEGSIQCNFDIANRIEHLSINTKAWTEYLPRSLWPSSESLDQKQSPKMSKNLKRPQQKVQAAPVAPPVSCIGDMGVPPYILQFLEIAEVMMVMGPLMEYSQKNPDLRPQDAMQRMVMDTDRSMRLQNQFATQQNGQIPMNAGQRTPGLSGPNQFASPAMNHLGLPQQGSPHVGGPAHTPSPAHLNQGGIPMQHQMSQGNSNLSGSQGPSTNTSPNVTNKRRRASQVKLEEENASQDVNGADKVKPSPRMGKRQKGTV